MYIKAAVDKETVRRHIDVCYKGPHHSGVGIRCNHVTRKRPKCQNDEYETYFILRLNNKGVILTLHFHLFDPLALHASCDRREHSGRRSVGRGVLLYDLI